MAAHGFTGPTDFESEVVAEHFRYLEQAMAKGVVALAGRTLNTDPTAFGIVIVDADEEHATALMEADPAVRQGVMTAELFPFRTALSRVTG